MKTKINFNVPQYAISVKNNTITCEISYSIDLTKWASMLGLTGSKFDRSMARVINRMGGIIVHCGPSVTVDMHVSASAKCHPQDTWNEKFGEDLATSRAKARAFLQASRMYEAICDAYVRRVSDLRTMGLNAFRCGMEHEQACAFIVDTGCCLDQAYKWYKSPCRDFNDKND